MKKAIALSFLLLAGTIILAHAVIPHHHHDTFAVCFSTTHCTDCEEEPEHSHDSDRDRHNDGCNPEECILLKEMYVRFDNNNLFVGSSLDSDISCPVLFLLSVSPMVDITGLENLPFRQNPLISYHTDYVTQSLGLRAPPF